MTDPSDLIKQSKSIHEAATPGPWEASDASDDDEGWLEIQGVWACGPSTPAGMCKADATFIATARTLIPQLADALSKSERGRAQTQEGFDGFQDDLEKVARRELNMRAKELKDATAEITRERDEARALLKVLQGRHQIASIAVASGLRPDATLDELYEHLAELRDG